MSGTVRVDLSAPGVAVAVKRARGDAVARLRHEADVLRLVAGPGVAELVSVDELPDGTVELATRYAGPFTLADAPPASMPEVLALLSRVAGALAAVHAAGVTHGAMSAEHVIVGPRGHPVLCGWGAATASSGGGVAAGGAEDVRALGAMMLDLVPDGADPAGRRVRALAANAVVDDPARRPPMTAVAAALDAVLAVAGPAHPDAAPPDRRRAPVRTATALGGLAAAAVAIVLAATAVGSPGSTAPAGPAARPSPQPSSTFDVSAPPASPTTTRPPTTQPRPRAERVWPRAAPVVEHGGRRWVAGAPGDLAFAVTWGCTADDRLAVVRPSTGAVYVFDEWPPAGTTPAGRLVARVDGASAVRADDTDGDGCGELQVVTNGGGVVSVDPGA